MLRGGGGHESFFTVHAQCSPNMYGCVKPQNLEVPHRDRSGKQAFDCKDKTYSSLSNLVDGHKHNVLHIT